MASDIEKLVVSLDADIRGLTNKLTKAGIFVKTTADGMDRDTARAARKISDNLSKGGHGSGANDNLASGLSYVQKQEFVHIGKSIADEIAAGQSPLRAIQVEGGRIVQAFGAGSGGVTGTMKALGSTLVGLASPAVLAAAGVAGIGLAAVLAYTSFEEAERGIKLGLLGIGAASGATVSDIRRIGAELAAAQGISTGAGEDIALSLAKTGKIDVGSIGDVGKLTKGYAALTGQDLGEAGKGLADIFSDPAKGADKLNAILGTLDSRTRSYIATLQAQGREQEAIRVLAAAVTPELEKAAAATSTWARAWQSFKNDVAGAGEVVNRVVQGAPANERLGVLQRKLNAEEHATASGQSESPATAAARDADMADLRRQIAALQKQAATADKAQLDAKDKVDTATASNRVADDIRGARPDDERIKNLENLIADIKRAIATPGVADKVDGGPEKVKAALASLESQRAVLKSEAAQGGESAAAALRQADFAKRKADLDSYAAGLADINNRFDEMALAARRAGQLVALPSIEKARAAQVAAYKANNDDKADKQFVLPPEFARTVIGSEGNNAARNPRSSASGFGQFTDATFLDQYRKVYPELAATLDDKGILAFKNDLAVNQKLIENYGKEIGRALTKAGIAPSLQNLYLGYHFGVGGAEKLLKADPNTSAAAILGPSVANANPEEVGGRTAGQLVAAVNARVLRNTAGGRAQTSAIAGEQAQAAAVGQSAAETARLTSITEQLNADRERGGELGQRFATATDLVKASSAALTPELAAERAEVLRLADARAVAGEAARIAASEAAARKAVGRERSDLGLTSDEAGVQNQVRGFGLDPASGAGGQIADQLREIRALTETKSEATSFVEGITHALIEGRSAAEAFHNALQRLGEKIADKAVDSLISSAFGGSGSGGLGALLGIGHADGTIVRGPGGPTADRVPALLSSGEAVIPARAVRQNLGVVQALIAGRYADGGIIGAPSFPAVNRQAGGGASSYVHAPTYNLPPAAAGVTPEQMVQAIDTYDRQSRRNMVSTFARARQRYA